MAYFIQSKTVFTKLIYDKAEETGTSVLDIIKQHGYIKDSEFHNLIEDANAESKLIDILFDRERTKPILPKDARDMIDNRKNQISALRFDPASPKPQIIDMLHAETFTSEEIMTMLRDTTHLRVYVGFGDTDNNTSKEMNLILVGIKDGKENIGGDTLETTRVLEFGIPCPPRCQEGEHVALYDLSSKP